MVQLYETGKPRAAIPREYELSPSALDRWIKQAQTSGSFSEKDNRTAEENELIALHQMVKLLMNITIVMMIAVILKTFNQKKVRLSIYMMKRIN